MAFETTTHPRLHFKYAFGNSFSARTPTCLHPHLSQGVGNYLLPCPFVGISAFFLVVLGVGFLAVFIAPEFLSAVSLTLLLTLWEGFTLFLTLHHSPPVLFDRSTLLPVSTHPSYIPALLSFSKKVYFLHAPNIAYILDSFLTFSFPNSTSSVVPFSNSIVS
jgi:hypothetical protein